MGNLTVVGTGIMFPSQMTFEAAEHIRAADVVLYNVGLNPVICGWMEENAQSSVDLYQLYKVNEVRSVAYQAMVDTICENVVAGKTTVAAFYGHPGVFVGPGYEAMKLCREKGFEARMLPGVSASDCMFADLEFDPARYGCTMVEATDYVMFDRAFSPDVPLVIWQAGLVADMTFKRSRGAEHADLLQERLLQDYPANHPIYSYVASTIPGVQFSVNLGTIGAIEEMELNASMTCLVPPLNPPKVDKAGIGAKVEQIMIDTVARASTPDSSMGS